METPAHLTAPRVRRVTVFCGGSAGVHPAYAATARELGARLAGAGVEVTLGGASTGLMGELADAALDNQGHVIGIITEDLLLREGAHRQLTELRVVSSLQVRKQMMADAADAFIALPGGPGTLDEISEQWSRALLGLHAKPCLLINVHGYYDGLRELRRRMVNEGFTRQGAGASQLVFCDSVEGALSHLGLVPRGAGAVESVPIERRSPPRTP